MAGSSNLGFATRAIHHGYDPSGYLGALNAPIFLTSTFCFQSAEEGRQRFSGEDAGFVYSRLGNPTVDLLERRLASLEGGEAAVATASGMGAIAATLWTLLRPGDELLADLTLYGCTFSLLHHGLSDFGISVRHVDMRDSRALADALNPRSKAIFFETPSNPNMHLVDIDAVTQLARPAGAIVVVDNTFATPLLQRPIALGADLVVQSATKYLGGHGDLIGGAVIGRESLIQKIRMNGIKDLTGAVLSPFDASLIMRGLKTLEVRVERHSANALIIAQMLEAHPMVDRVFYPGLPSFPQHELAQRQMIGGFGGVMSIEVAGGNTAALRFMDRLKLIRRAVSLGDTETLVQHPASMTHSTYTAEERAAHGISDSLVRLSIGLESASDILSDLQEALVS